MSMKHGTLTTLASRQKPWRFHQRNISNTPLGCQKQIQKKTSCFALFHLNLQKESTTASKIAQRLCRCRQIPGVLDTVLFLELQALCSRKKTAAWIGWYILRILKGRIIVKTIHCINLKTYKLEHQTITNTETSQTEMEVKARNMNLRIYFIISMFDNLTKQFRAVHVWAVKGGAGKTTNKL